MSISRRRFLKGAAGAGALAVLPWQLGCTTAPPIYKIFVHGVAAGDPLVDAVILWTRVSTATAPTAVTWEVSADPGFGKVVAFGAAIAEPAKDFCCKVDAKGLTAGTTYYYRFKALSETSPVGRARTLPAAGASAARLALASCSSYAHGYFHGYRELAERNDLDALIHLGDYIYEYQNDGYGSVRTYDPPWECLTLADYRLRYAHYRGDANLRALHESVAMIAVWDDHEFADNAYKDGARNHQPQEGSWEDRVAAAAQAYHEWMPIRDGEDPKKIFRSFSFGGLFDLIMLDTRLWGRDIQFLPADMAAQAESRTLLGLDQETWLHDQLTRSTATWKVLGQQVMVGQLPQFSSDDAWDAYPRARERLLDAMNAGGKNVVVLTGDLHTSWVMDLTPDAMDPAKYNGATGEGSRAVEIVVPGITSPGLTKDLQELALQLVPSDPWIKYVDVYRRGYVIFDVTPAQCQATFHHFENIELEAKQDSTVSVVATVLAGKNSVTVALA